MGKLIAHCEKSPIIVPIYHRGMDNVLPEKVLKDKKTKRPSTPISPIPRIGNDIRLFVGESIDFTEKVWLWSILEVVVIFELIFKKILKLIITDNQQ